MQLFTPQEYLKIDIANSYGLDKLTWAQRLEWFDQHEHQLLGLLPKAEEKALYFAGVKAWQDYKDDKPTGYPINLDATASGFQLLACLTGDREAARLCNVLNTGTRMDAYTALYEQMAQRVSQEEIEHPKLSRSQVKDAIMTSLYGSEKVPKKIFGEGPLLQAFYQTMKETVPGVWELNEAFLDMWDDTALEYSWVMPDNFHVKIKVTDQVTEPVTFFGEEYPTFRTAQMPVHRGRSLGANVTHSLDGMVVRELNRRCDFDPERIKYVRVLLQFHSSEPTPLVFGASEDDQMVLTLWEHYLESGYLSARILDHLMPENQHVVDKEVIQELLDSLPAKPFKLLSVHDCFRCHPNYGNDLRKQYNQQLFLIARSNLLQFLLRQVFQNAALLIEKQGDFAQEILDSDYALS